LNKKNNLDSKVFENSKTEIRFRNAKQMR